MVKKQTKKHNTLKLFKSLTKKTRKHKKRDYCAIYKHDFVGKPTPQLFRTCKMNSSCRKQKCDNIDKKFKSEQIKRLGNDYNGLLMSSVYNKCPETLSNKSRKRCYNKSMAKFYEDNNMKDIYDKLQECDKKTCNKERQIFYTNLFKIRRQKKQIKIHQPLVIKDIPDKQLIEMN